MLVSRDVHAQESKRTIPISRTEFNQQIQVARDQILDLGCMVELAIAQSVRAPKENDLERMADHVTNVYERTVYLSTGELGESSDTLGHRKRK